MPVGASASARVCLPRADGQEVDDACCHAGFCADSAFGAPVDLCADADAEATEVNVVEKEQMRVRSLAKQPKPLLTAGEQSALVANKRGLVPRQIGQALRADLA